MQFPLPNAGLVYSSRAVLLHVLLPQADYFRRGILFYPAVQFFGSHQWDTSRRGCSHPSRKIISMIGSINWGVRSCNQRREAPMPQAKTALLGYEVVAGDGLSTGKMLNLNPSATLNHADIARSLIVKYLGKPSRVWGSRWAVQVRATTPPKSQSQMHRSMF